MILRESPIRSPAHHVFGWWIVLVVSIFPGVLAAESPVNPSARKDSPRSGRLPGVETRIYFAWPDFLAAKPAFFKRDDPRSVPLSRNPTPPGKLFGAIGWLSGAQDKPGFDFFGDSLGLRADDRSIGGPDLLNPDFLNRSDLSDAEITLVRGGPPRLFGALGRVRAEYGDEFEDVQRIRGQLLLSLIANQIGIDASVNSWEDNKPRPKGLGDFWTGDANLVYSMGAQRIAMRGGLGASWVHDNDLDVGYNWTYGADVFLTRPWLVSGEIDYGKINSEKLFHWRATFGVQLFYFEAYVGYDSYKWDHIRFDGPVAGGGFWF